MAIARRLVVTLLLSIVLAVAGTPARAAPYQGDFPWQDWGEAIFAQAAREGKFVIVSLQSWWCPWCHAMNRDTYDNPEVRQYLLQHFIPVRVDQDSRPDLSQRWERWGWPATVILAADGTEIVKLRGFYSPQFFLPILRETVRDPSPVDYGSFGGPERERSLATSLTAAQRQEILDFIDKAWDAEHAGWGKAKIVDGPTLVWHLDRAKLGDALAERRMRAVMPQLRRLQDRPTGAISQVSTAPDWSGMKREFPMFAQEAGLRAFAQAWALWGDPQDLATARAAARFLIGTLQSPQGGFYASLGLEDGQPGIDRRLYARETAQAISGLLGWYDVSADPEALAAARRAADWAEQHRALPGGGFRHAARDPAGPYLADNIEMAKALLYLHRSTGERHWLERARRTADFIARHFIDPRTGGFFAAAAEAAAFAAPVKQREDNATATRFFNLLSFYTGERRYREIAEAGMGYLTSPAILDAYGFLPDLLQAEEELKHEPVHITIVGPRDDARALELHRAALRYPLDYKRVEWWDRREGPLPNPDVDYPDHAEGPAAFACTARFCSLPVTAPAEIAGQVDRLQRALGK